MLDDFVPEKKHTKIDVLNHSVVRASWNSEMSPSLLGSAVRRVSLGENNPP